MTALEIKTGLMVNAMALWDFCGAPSAFLSGPSSSETRPVDVPVLLKHPLGEISKYEEPENKGFGDFWNCLLDAGLAHSPFTSLLKKPGKGKSTSLRKEPWRKNSLFLLVPGLLSDCSSLG